MRLGIVGLGAVAQAVYLPLLARHPELFEIAAVADLSRGLFTAIGERHRVPPRGRYGTGDELLAAGGIDGALLLASGSHGALAEVALNGGLAVLCEKPLAWTLAEADRLAAIPGASDRLLLGYMKLYDPAVERAIDLARQRPPLRSLEVTVLHPTPEAQLAQSALLPPPDDVPPETARASAEEADALRERALGPAAAPLGRLYTDVLLGSIVHDLALIRALAGNPEAVDYAEAWPDKGNGLFSPDSVAVAGRFPGGARFSIRWHFLAGYPAYREEVRLHDEAGSIELAFLSPYLLFAPTELTVVVQDGTAAARTRFRSTEEAFERQLLAFHALWRGEGPPRAGVEEGRADIVTCQRIADVVARERGLEIGGEAAASGAVR